MPEPADELARLHRDLGLKPLRPLWAKLEILLGLAAVAAGLFSGMNLSHRPAGEVPPWAWVGPVALFTLGGYLALAGHRSHLYQSSNRLTAYLAARAGAATEPRDHP
jgi:hypothetical protein